MSKYGNVKLGNDDEEQEFAFKPLSSMVVVRPAPTVICEWCLQSLVQMSCASCTSPRAFRVQDWWLRDSRDGWSEDLACCSQGSLHVVSLRSVLCCYRQVKDQIMVHMYYLVANMVYAFGWTCLFMAEGTFVVHLVKIRLSCCVALQMMGRSPIHIIIERSRQRKRG